jgi:hypothetical protein
MTTSQILDHVRNCYLKQFREAVSELEKTEGMKMAFQVDFGSAPVESFEELLFVLRDLGANQIEIG